MNTAVETSGAVVRLRVLLIDNVNTEEDFFEQLQELSKLPGVTGTDIEPYHNMDMGKEKKWQDCLSPAMKSSPRHQQSLSTDEAKNCLKNKNNVPALISLFSRKAINFFDYALPAACGEQNFSHPEGGNPSFIDHSGESITF